ncbi:MAG: hypothetical protein RR306_01315 [Clostridia bacterium]
MNLKSKMIIEEYEKEKPNYIALGNVVDSKLRALIKEKHMNVLAIEHRVKEEQSLIGKLEIKGDKYKNLSEITDILGARVISFFSDDVDEIAMHIEKMFDIDWENSVDKRAQLSPEAFGYLSLHYICSLPFNGEYPKEICGKKFEIQLRSSLQHTWSAINHDLGYKSEFGVPRNIVREFSRVAGLLEVADEQFSHIKKSMADYCQDVRTRIADNKAENINIDMVSLKEYLLLNKKMRDFLSSLASICGAEISDIDPQSYIEQLSWLGMKTLGDLQNMLESNEELALALAECSLRNTELDILSSTVGLRFLCRAELLTKGYTEEKVAEFILLGTENKDRALRQAKRLFSQYDIIRGDRE